MGVAAAARSSRCSAPVFATVLLLLLCRANHAAGQTVGQAVVVRNGYEFHAALTSPGVTWILLASNVTLSLDTCPFPSSPEFPATVLHRNITVSSLSPPSLAAATAATGGPPAGQDATSAGTAAAEAAARGPFWLDCSFLNARFAMTAGHTVVFDSLVLLNCRTVNTFGYFLMQNGSRLVLNNTVDFQGPSSVCLPLQIGAQLSTLFPGPESIPSATGNHSQQATAYAPADSGWCAAGAAGQSSTSVPPLLPDLLPLLMTNSSSAGICRQEAALLGNFARTERPLPYEIGNSSRQQLQEPVDILWHRSAWLCLEPQTGPCVGQNATESCFVRALAQVDPDANPPCPAVDAASLRTCLTTPSFTRIMVVSDLKLDASEASFPPSMAENPPVIGRNISIESDARGPRMVLDCALLSDRLQVAPGVTVTAWHVVLANCSIGAEKPLIFLRFSQGAQLVMRDSFVLQPTDLCLPVQQQQVALPTETRPASFPSPASQQVRLGNASSWCPAGPYTASAAVSGANNSSTAVRVPPTESPQDNSSYSRLPQIFANRTGLGPAYAAALEQPARVPFYTHPTWPHHQFCDQQVLLLVDFAYNDRFAWDNPAGSGTGDAAAAAAPDDTNATAQQQREQLPPAVTSRLGSGYSSSLPVHYINSTFVCQQPSAACADAPSNGTRSACLLAAYARLDPDAAAGAGEGAAVGAPGRKYGVSVVLPAVLASVGGALLLAALAACLLVARRRQHTRQKARADAEKGPSMLQPSNVMGALFGTSGTPASTGLADPERRLLQSPGSLTGTYSTISPATTTAGSSTAVIGSVSVGSTGGTAGSFLSLGAGQSSSKRHIIPQTGRQFVAPEDIMLGVAIGSGSFGRVYSGSWKGRPVAVKVISHSSADDVPISRELIISVSFDHPNLVRTLHYARIRLNDQSDTAGLGLEGATAAGGSTSFLPQGAIGVFDLPSHWAVVQQQMSSDEPIIDTETWIVMDLMDRGTLASAVRRGMFVVDGTLRPAMLLRRCADVAAGLAYLHSRNVCHGDLKCENVLLRSEPQDPDGMMASVADFGLSRALALGQSHLSTRRYGTVTHMPPELLVAGKLTPAADLYSFGVMMWEVVSRVHPFAGLHHGEVIHRVVTEDMRPGPWPAEATQVLPPGYVALAESCWARQRTKRPSAQEVLRELLSMLAQVEGEGGTQAEAEGGGQAEQQQQQQHRE